MSIAYQQGFKYQLEKSYAVETGITGWEIEHAYLKLCEDGRLYVDAGYAWDGPSGPTFDTSNFMRGSLVHDALYQLMREEKLPRSLRDTADQLLRKLCREDGMSWLRAWWVYQGVKWFASKATLPSNRREILYAP